MTTWGFIFKIHWVKSVYLITIREVITRDTVFTVTGGNWRSVPDWFFNKIRWCHFLSTISALSFLELKRCTLISLESKRWRLPLPWMEYPHIDNTLIANLENIHFASHPENMVARHNKAHVIAHDQALTWFIERVIKLLLIQDSVELLHIYSRVISRVGNVDLE